MARSMLGDQGGMCRAKGFAETKIKWYPLISIIIKPEGFWDTEVTGELLRMDDEFLII
jgi:hypothetical protein